jgi:TPR repeat protein
MLMLLAAALANAPPAHADLYSALSIFKKGDYASAFQQFLALAKLGQPVAELDVAYMYRGGLGTRQSDIHAYAWAMLASRNGEPKGLKLAQQLLPTLALAPGSRRIAAWITAPYTPQALERTLLPRKSPPKGPQPGRLAREQPCRAVKLSRPSYPLRELMDGEQGRLLVAFTVLPDGTTRLPHVLVEAPLPNKSDFDFLTRQSILRSRFAPRPGSVPVECALDYQFQASHLAASDYSGLQRYLRRARMNARAGDPMAALVYGTMLAGLPQIHERRGAALPWLIKAAQAGIAAGEFDTGASLLTGWGMSGWGSASDIHKGLRWLHLAAAQNDPDAEALLAQWQLRGTPALPAVEQAVRWLDQAAAQDNEFGDLYLAAVLAAWPQPAIRNPGRALLLEKKAYEDGVGVDPTGLEIRAAAHAAAGDFNSAVRDERKALTKARDLHWSLAPLRQRLLRYQAHEPWYGNLLDYGSPG